MTSFSSLLIFLLYLGLSAAAPSIVPASDNATYISPRPDFVWKSWEDPISYVHGKLIGRTPQWQSCEILSINIAAPGGLDWNRPIHESRITVVVRARSGDIAYAGGLVNFEYFHARAFKPTSERFRWAFGSQKTFDWPTAKRGLTIAAALAFAKGVAREHGITPELEQTTFSVFRNLNKPDGTDALYVFRPSFKAMDMPAIVINPRTEEVFAHLELKYQPEESARVEATTNPGNHSFSLMSDNVFSRR